MKVLGLTGGIGSGKTTVAKMFAEFGVPVYIADDQAKLLMHSDRNVRLKITELFGDNAYEDGQLNRKFLAEKVFHDKSLLERLNQIVHPAVERDFLQWKSLQKTPYVLYEAAILFEKGGYKKCDKTLLITAPREVRIQRVMDRDGVEISEIEARMNHQWSDEKKAKLADFVIVNTELWLTRREVEKIHEIMLESA